MRKRTRQRLAFYRGFKKITGEGVFYASTCLHLQQSSKYSLAQKTTIQQLLAAALLLIFSFSITPRKFLHDALANHKDKTVMPSADGTAQFSHTGFVCKCDNQVAESPFTDVIACFEFAAPRFFSEYKHARACRVYASTFLFCQRRGPPAA